MAGCRQKEIDPERETPKACGSTPKSDGQHRGGQQSGKHKGVRKSPVAPKVAIVNAKSKTNDVKIRDYRAKHACHPNALWSAGPVETCSDAEGRNRMREQGRQGGGYLQDYKQGVSATRQTLNEFSTDFHGLKH